MQFNPVLPFFFGNFLHEDTHDIISDNLIKYDIPRLTTFRQGSTTRYTKKVYKRHKIDLPTPFGYHYCGDYPT